MATEVPLPRVFISYAHTESDTALARNLEKWLTAAGIKVSGFSQLEGGLEDAFMRATEE